jgi:alkylresorcinol/alkylpyrone synthase/polyketide synthase Type III
MSVLPSPRILGIGTSNPPRRYSQREIYDISAVHFPMYRSPRIEQIFMNSDIDYRHFSFDKETFVPNETADQLHARFEDHAVPLAAEAARACLDAAGAEVGAVDAVIAVSCTGYLCPGISALLIKEMAMRVDVQRADLIGMGCAGAMPGLQRAYDFVRANPGKRALVVTVEICSACYYVDESLETVVGNAICGDGAAAVLVGDDAESSGPQILRFETLLEPSFIHTVGFQFRGGKLRIVLSKDIRDAAGGLAAKLVGSLLAAGGVDRREIAHWIIHSGGRKVIDGIKDEIGLAEDQLKWSRETLKNFGNMSSPTVLFVLESTIANAAPMPGDLGVMLAMGPGLAIEGALLRW